MKALDVGHLAESKKPIRLKMPSDEGYQLTILGASGSGKTNALYRLIEQMPQDRPIFIADPEQDFIPLRRHRDFVLVGKGRDLPADPSLAPMLARRFLETGFNIIWDSHEEKRKETRELFLMAFLETLHDAPRSMWRAATLVLDELDIWAPESGAGVSKATEACANAAKRFRKRGFDLIMATTRPSEVDKTVISMSRNWLIGLQNIDTDIKRSLSFLGFTEKEDRQTYRALQRAEFFARGPEFGLLRPEKMLVSQSKLYDPKANKGAAIRPPAAKGQIKKLLEELQNLPQQAEEEARTLVDLQRQLRELKAQLKEARRGIPKTDPQALEKQFNAGFAKGSAEVAKMRRDQKYWKNRLLAEVERIVGVINSLPEGPEQPAPAPRAPIQHQRAQVIPIPKSKPAPDPEGRTFGACERKILGFLLAQAGKQFTQSQVAAMTGYANSGGFRNALANLNQAGLINRGNGMLSLAEGTEIQAAELADSQPHTLEDWVGKLGACERAIYGKMLGDPDMTWSKEEMAHITGYSNSGGFRNALARLNTLGLMRRHQDGRIGLNPDIQGFLR